MRKTWGILLLAALSLPIGAGAMVPEGTAHIAHTLSDVTEESEYSFSSMTEGEGSGESTLFFNDGLGRLTEFHMTSGEGEMELTISQNGREIYRTHAAMKSRRFSVMRRESMGEIYFLITLGDKAYRGYQDRDDRWHMEEMPPKEKGKAVPLTTNLMKK